MDSRTQANETEVPAPLAGKYFAPSRLQVARSVRQRTKAELARTVGLAASTLVAYEDGTRTPPIETVNKLAAELRLPVSYFFGEEFDLIGVDAPSFRSRRSMKAQLRDRVIGYGEWAINAISPELNRIFELPRVDILDLEGEDAESAAVTLRNYWRLGDHPIPNMIHLLESKGVECYWLNEDSPTVDAFSFQREHKPFVLLNSQGQAGDRDRLNAAHELAHLILHKNKERAEGRDIEAEAFRFAGAFLLPADAFKADCPRFPVLMDFCRMKQKWGVSVAAMLRRAKELGILTERQYIQGCKEISILGWRRKEPVSIAVANEESLAHLKMFGSLNEKGTSPFAFARKVDLPIDDLLVLVPTARRFLPAEGRQIKHLRLL